MAALNDLLERLRRRASDPNRRVDAREDAFSAQVTTLDLSSLMGMLGQAAADLKRVVVDNQAGLVDPELVMKADGHKAAMSTPAPLAPLPAPAQPPVLKQVEADLGFALPPILRRVYLEVADGGFGPGGGLLGLADAAATYARMRAGDELPRGRTWPERLVPIVTMDPGYDCVDASSPVGRIISWDPEGLGEFSGEKAWNRSFSEVAPSVEAWLDRWVGGTTREEQMQDLMRKSMINSARQSRAYFAAMTPQQRAEYGLPEVGWEKQIANGLGLEEEQNEMP